MSAEKVIANEYVIIERFSKPSLNTLLYKLARKNINNDMIDLIEE